MRALVVYPTRGARKLVISAPRAGASAAPRDPRAPATRPILPAHAVLAAADRLGVRRRRGAIGTLRWVHGAAVGGQGAANPTIDASATACDGGALLAAVFAPAAGDTPAVAPAAASSSASAVIPQVAGGSLIPPLLSSPTFLRLRGRSLTRRRARASGLVGSGEGMGWRPMACGWIRSHPQPLLLSFLYDFS